MYIKRDLEEKIRNYLKAREIITILGPRQAGKTTLMKHIYNTLGGKKVFLDFEDPDIVQLFDEDIKAFAKLYVKDKDFVFIDEFQYSLKGGKNLKFLYDTYNTKLIVSGSSSADVTFKLLSSLVGRIFIMELYPLSLKEVLNHKSSEEFLIANEYLQSQKAVPTNVHNFLIKEVENFSVYGGYPRVVISEREDERKQVLKNLMITYLMKDIKGFFRISKEYSFNKLLTSVSLQVGNLIRYSELANTCNLTQKDVKEYLQILEETYILRLIKPFYSNKRTEITKSPKLYFIDTGLRNSLLKNYNNLSLRTDKGALMENFIFSELIKNSEEDIKYWRTKSKGEVDFIIEKGDKIIPVEVKSGVSTSAGKSLLSFIEKYNPSYAVVFHRGNFRVINKIGKRIFFLPFYADLNNFINNLL